MSEGREPKQIEAGADEGKVRLRIQREDYMG